MGTVKVYLETRYLDKEYAHPFVREAKAGDKIEFIAVDANFEVHINNKDNFFDGGQAALNLDVIPTESRSTPTIKSSIDNGEEKYYSAYCEANEKYTDKIGASPPKIIIVP